MRTLAFVALSFGLVACGGAGTSTPPSDPASPQPPEPQTPEPARASPSACLGAPFTFVMLPEAVPRQTCGDFEARFPGEGQIVVRHFGDGGVETLLMQTMAFSVWPSAAGVNTWTDETVACLGLEPAERCDDRARFRQPREACTPVFDVQVLAPGRYRPLAIDLSGVSTPLRCE
jgi:hypothetical protein